MTAKTGVLIVALTMALGLHDNNRRLMALAFAMAGLSYLVSLIDETFDDTPGARSLRFILTLGMLTAGVVAYVVAAWDLIAP